MLTMEKINMEPFSLKILQETKTLLKEFQLKGFTDLNQILDNLESYIKEEISKKISKQLLKKMKCPYCGSSMALVSNPDMLKILGCKKCRYSKITE